MESPWSVICSGLVGAIIGQLLMIAWQAWKDHQSIAALKNAIEEECRYNLSILDEIKHGLTEARGSFKRLSVDFLKVARDEVASSRGLAHLAQKLTTVCVDMELYNLEASYIFNGKEDARILTGVLGEQTTYLRMETEKHDITETILRATEGVRGSLNAVLNCLKGDKA